MEFTFTMRYDYKAMAAMARAMRVGLQTEQDKKSKLIGWLFVVATLVILITSGKTDWAQIVGYVAVFLFMGYILFSDHINGALALFKIPEKMRNGQWLFREDGYFSSCEAGESDFSYENIFAIAEAPGYIFLVFHNGSAQILDVTTIQGGTLAQFRTLLRRKTSLTIQEC